MIQASVSITGTFGIKGELKVYSESDFVEYRFRKNAKIYLSDNLEYTVSSSRTHKGNVLITINDINDINLVLDKVGMKIYAFNFHTTSHHSITGYRTV